MRSTRNARLLGTMLVWLSGMALVTAPSYGAGLDYPTRPITITCGMAAGGGASVALQIFADGARKYLKTQPIILNYKPGGTGLVATDFVMKQQADGYNLLWIPPDTPWRMALEPKKISFTLKDFSYIGTFCSSPYLLGVNMDGPYKTIEEFIASAKKQPGEMTYASSGIAGGAHFLGELLMRETGIKLTHVPFPSGNPAILSVLGNHTSCTIMTPGAFGAHIKAGGKARPLIVFDEKRFPDLPDVPTAREKGINIARDAYFFLVAKQRTPQPILDILVKVFKETASDPAVHATLAKAGLLPSNLGPEATDKKVTKDYNDIFEVFGKLGLFDKQN
jgi:tripartite-type tricarboxylate transporter receptor subunit TctC